MPPSFRALLLLSASSALVGQRDAAKEEWKDLFNGRNLDGWVVKIGGHELGDNYGETFRAGQGGVIQVSYDKYDTFGARFSHLFYKKKLSHYRLAMEYRFVGDEGWAWLCAIE